MQRAEALLLTVSSQLKNPLTSAGRVVDVALELWAVVVAGSAGASASFFQSGDRASTKVFVSGRAGGR